MLCRPHRGEWVCAYTHKLGAHVDEPKTHLTYGFATQVVILNDDGSIQKIIAAHDVGKVINPKLLQGHIRRAKEVRKLVYQTLRLLEPV